MNHSKDTPVGPVTAQSMTRLISGILDENECDILDADCSKYGRKLIRFF